MRPVGMASSEPFQHLAGDETVRCAVVQGKAEAVSIDDCVDLDDARLGVNARRAAFAPRPAIPRFRKREAPLRVVEHHLVALQNGGGQVGIVVHRAE